MIFVYVSVLVYAYAYVWVYTPVRTFRDQKKAPDILLFYLPTIPLRQGLFLSGRLVCISFYFLVLLCFGVCWSETQ